MSIFKISKVAFMLVLIASVKSLFHFQGVKSRLCSFRVVKILAVWSQP